MFVPATELELRNTATAAVLPARTNETGVYSFLSLQHGSYDLKVVAKGFKAVELTGIVLQSYQASGMTIGIEAGGVAENVTVRPIPFT